MGSKVEVEAELKSNADKLWECIRESSTLFPKIFPQQYESIEVLEGDGKSVGSVRLVKFAPGISEISCTKEKIESVDEVNKTVSYSVVDGDILKFYKNFKGNLCVSVNLKGDGSLVKWWCEFDKASEEIPDPDLLKHFALKNFQDLDDYLLKSAA
ncbi:MLP-like protein 423 [Henckelia pumila]|uniref:MLP-like protein 423 n=1 Tax=Henckelia pumila TaxID=405737 RepID=UPI003C6E4E66